MWKSQWKCWKILVYLQSYSFWNLCYCFMVSVFWVILLTDFVNPIFWVLYFKLVHYFMFCFPLISVFSFSLYFMLFLSRCLQSLQLFLFVNQPPMFFTTNHTPGYISSHILSVIVRSFCSFSMLMCVILLLCRVIFTWDFVTVRLPTL